MADRARCRINTDVFEKAESLVLHFCRSIQDIQECIDQYLKDASADFSHQLDVIEQRLEDAIAEEKRCKTEKEDAQTEWDRARRQKVKAKHALDEAKANTNSVRNQYKLAKDENQKAYDNMREAKEQWREAKEEQQDAYDRMKDREISHDEFEDYMDDTRDKKEDFLEMKDALNGTKETLDQKKAELNEAKDLEKNAVEDLSYARQQEYQAEQRFHVAEKEYEEAKRMCKIREANLKESKEIVLQFEMYKDDYYHQYLMGENMSCNQMLTFLWSHMRREFGEAMQVIEASVNDILLCSLKKGLDYDDSYVCQSGTSPKTWETRRRIEDGLRDHKMQLNRDMKRPEDEHPNYAERCKDCGLLISLCECDKGNAPLSLDE